MHLNHSLQRKTVKPSLRRVPRCLLVNGEVGAVEEQSGVRALTNSSKKVEQVKITEEHLAWRVLWQYLAAGRLAKSDDTLGEFTGRLVRQDGRKEQHVRRLAGAEVPQAGVTTEPGWIRTAKQALEAIQPGGVEVLGLIKVDVQEMIGSGQASIQPGLGLWIEPLEDLRP
jgi:hypothetical protein